jgi:MFS family permease
MASSTSKGAFEAWGWRVPFLLSALLVVIGLWVRTSVTESPVFEAAQAEAADRAPTRAPILEVLRRNGREVLIAMGARFAENIVYYVLTVFSLTYATTKLGFSKQAALNAVLVGAVVHLVAIPAWGALSDRLGRRPLYLAGAIGTGIWAFGFFALANTRSWALLTVAVCVGLILHAAMYGPQAAFFSELFGTDVRYSGASIGYQLASIFAGSLAPIISVWLLGRYGTSTPISVYVALAAVVTVVAVTAARETAGTDLAGRTRAAEATVGAGVAS